ncbi:MAG: hypothetical protein ACFCVA_14970 [Gammaproteobacteria bacterium]
MKKIALSSAIALTLGFSAASLANEVDGSLLLKSDLASAGHGGAAASQNSAAASDSFNSYSRYDLDVTKTYNQSTDVNYWTEITIEENYVVASSDLRGTVSGNRVGSAPGALAFDDISVRTVGKAANSIDGSRTTGIAAISQTIGNNNLNQQSAVVQANFNM